jgi:tripartite-type tricarboxylate transporter receptor subunit TctC
VKARWAVSLLIAVILAPSPLLSRSCAAADTWPSRPVRFIVTLGPGSGVDISARLFADRLSTRWGQPVVVENHPGGDGMLAITSFLSAHDDHTSLVSPVSSFIAHPYFHNRLPYDSRNLIPIARISNTVLVVCVPTSLNVNSLKELVALARSRPGQLNWATGTGLTDFVFAGFLHTVGLTMAKVPYKNPVAAATDLAAGTIQVYMASYAIVRPQVEAEKVKVLAVINHTRAPVMPEVPTAVEAGYPSLELDGVVGFFGPPEMADDVRARIADDITTVASDPNIAKMLMSTGQIVSAGNGAAFAASIAQQRAQVAEVAKLFGNRPVK